MKTLKTMRGLPLAVAMLVAIQCCIAGCGASDKDDRIPDTMNVATLYGPASFFSYRDTLMGYDYEMMEELAHEHGFAVKWIVADSLEEAIALVRSGNAMLLAAGIPDTGSYRSQLALCGPKSYIEHVLVQPRGDTIVVDVDQLKGRTVYVEKGSDSEAALAKLNEKLGGDIKIRPVDPDSLAVEDMLAAVARGDMNMAVVDGETAKLNRTYYPDLNITLAISEPVEARWGVADSHKWLADEIDRWMKEATPVKRQGEILDKYFKSLKNMPVAGAKYDRQFKNGYASPFDALYKKHTANTNWDWRLLAAQGYTESRFDSTARSWAGAAGVMQIMPNTGRAFGLAKKEMGSADRSIETAVKILDHYDGIMSQYVQDPVERQKFTMAAYNAGPGHVMDAIRLAKKHGLDPQKWDGNVEKAMLMKMNRKYYRDPVVKHGYSRGRETVDYVKRIWSYYKDAADKIPA